MKLSTWIATEGGPTVVARRLGVAPQNIHSWLRGVTVPRPLVLQRLIKMADGDLTYETVIKEASRNQKKVKLMKAEVSAKHRGSSV